MLTGLMGLTLDGHVTRDLPHASDTCLVRLTLHSVRV